MKTKFMNWLRSFWRRHIVDDEKNLWPTYLDAGVPSDCYFPDIDSRAHPPVNNSNAEDVESSCPKRGRGSAGSKRFIGQ